jgi:rhamnosyltransferase
MGPDLLGPARPPHRFRARRVSTPRVSIVVPTRNGEATLPALLASLRQQRVPFEFEIVAIDSASTDGTPGLLRNTVDQFIEIAAGDFDHGLTRNLGVGHARGELVVLLVQDALPASDGWLAALTAPLFNDERVAGTFARQMPRPEAGAITGDYLSRWVAASEVPRTSVITDRDEFDALDPSERFLRCVFDNVCSCIRRSIWLRHPFPATPIGEDLEWARDVLLAGYRLEYVPAAAVIHSHDRPAIYEFRRTCVLHRRLYELFGLRTIPTLPLLIRAVASSWSAHFRCRKASAAAPFNSAHAIALAFAWPLGQYLGALSAVRGWKPFRFRGV